MTRTEEKEMAELGMTPEQLAQRQAQIAKMTEAPAPVKKPRSDKGKPRKPAPEPQAQAGALDETQANKLRVLLEDVVQAERAYWDAEDNRNRAMIAYNAHVESLRKP